ncbi:TIGR02285 family protein [Vibrio salinus]|uniref:TIGR02285 family protein n=1 Tax=Vibrio salinus TaxID=2899784 RepID=UPI001E39521C|nr:TIGR02285 family protein [Vibrio salinus]MCE0494710.1 TIGR02285 family protein [Vibrio salinus]
MGITALNCALVAATVLSLTYSQTSVANTGKIITWYKSEFPPLSIVNGPDAGKGYSDRIEQFLFKNLKGYDHKILVAPVKRTLRDMEKGVNACAVTLLKTPAREKFVAFTRPARLLLPNSLIIRKSDVEKIKPFIGSDGKVLLEDIIKSHSFRIGYTNGRSYTKPIDNLLNKYQTSGVFVDRLGKDSPKGLLSMLSKKHIDAILQQPVEAQFNARTLNMENSIKVLPIREIKDYTVGYIGCSKTPWGKEVVRKIDALMKDAVKRNDFRSFYETFLDDESKIRYRKVYSKFFRVNG